MDTVFKAKQTSQATQEAPVKHEEGTVGQSDHVEVPFLDYKMEHGHPKSVDYFQLGDVWEETFGDEIGTIEGYLKMKVENGELANSTTAIEKELKSLERMNNLKDEERTVIKIGTLASYVKFLMETEDIKRNMRKYAYR